MALETKKKKQTQTILRTSHSVNFNVHGGLRRTLIQPRHAHFTLPDSWGVGGAGLVGV